MANREKLEILQKILQCYSTPQRQAKLLAKIDSLYLVHSFKIKAMTVSQAADQYSRLADKYQSGELVMVPNDWHKNERQLFLWYLVCYSQDKSIPIDNIEDRQWFEMSTIFFYKNPLFLKYQGLTIFKNISKHKWSSTDDRNLESLVSEFGTNQWNEISKTLFLRKQGQYFISSKQCRQRWHNHINKNLNKNPWTPKQDRTLLQLSREVGKKWSQIARLLNTNRTQHMVKNRYVSMLNKARVTGDQDQEHIVGKLIQQTFQENCAQLGDERDQDQDQDQDIGEIGEDMDDENIIQRRVMEDFKQKEELMNNTQIDTQDKNLKKELDMRIKINQKGVCSLMFSPIEEKEELDIEGTQNKNEKKVTELVSCLIKPTEDGFQQTQHISQPLLFAMTPSTVRPSLFSPFTFQNGFDMFFKELQRHQNPFYLSPHPHMQPYSSSFSQLSLSSFSISLPAVGVSQLSQDILELSKKKPSSQDDSLNKKQ